MSALAQYLNLQEFFPVGLFLVGLLVGLPVSAVVGKRMANTPTELQYLGRWCPRILSGRDHPYRQDFHAPTQLLPQTI